MSLNGESQETVIVFVFFCTLFSAEFFAERMSFKITRDNMLLSVQRFESRKTDIRMILKLKGEKIIISAPVMNSKSVIILLKSIIKLYALRTPNFNDKNALKNLPPSKGRAGIRLKNPMERLRRIK